MENLASISNGAKARAENILVYEQGVSRKLGENRSKYPDLFPARSPVISNPTIHQGLEECYERLSNSLANVCRKRHFAPNMKTYSMVLDSVRPISS
jgi:hypothetical protein